MLIKIGKWHLVFITGNKDGKLWRERWFSLFPFRFNEKYTVQMRRRLGMTLKKGCIPGESIFPPKFNIKSKEGEKE